MTEMCNEANTSSENRVETIAECVVGIAHIVYSVLLFLTAAAFLDTLLSFAKQHRSPKTTGDAIAAYGLLAITVICLLIEIAVFVACIRDCFEQRSLRWFMRTWPYVVASLAAYIGFCGVDFCNPTDLGKAGNGIVADINKGSIPKVIDIVVSFIIVNYCSNLWNDRVFPAKKSYKNLCTETDNASSNKKQQSHQSLWKNVRRNLEEFNLKETIKSDIPKFLPGMLLCVLGGLLLYIVLVLCKSVFWKILLCCGCIAVSLIGAVLVANTFYDIAKSKFSGKCAFLRALLIGALAFLFAFVTLGFGGLAISIGFFSIGLWGGLFAIIAVAGSMIGFYIFNKRTYPNWQTKIVLIANTIYFLLLSLMTAALGMTGVNNLFNQQDMQKAVQLLFYTAVALCLVFLAVETIALLYAFKDVYEGYATRWYIRTLPFALSGIGIQIIVLKALSIPQDAANLLLDIVNQLKGQSVLDQVSILWDIVGTVATYLTVKYAKQLFNERICPKEHAFKESEAAEIPC